MTNQPAQSPTSIEIDPANLRKLAHDLRTPLSIISMGIEILKQVRNDDEQFQRVLTMMSSEGVGPLKRAFDEIARQAPTDPDIPAQGN